MTVAKEEGAGALWKGVIPGVHRQCLFGGLRIGLYDPVKVQTVQSERGASIAFALPPVSRQPAVILFEVL